MDSDVDWFNRFLPEDVKREIPIDFASESWKKTSEILSELSSSNDLTANKFRESVEKLSSLNWSRSFSCPAISALLTQEFLEEMSFGNFYSEVVPFVCSQVLRLPSHFTEFPHLALGVPSRVHFPRSQCVGLLGALYFACSRVSHSYFSGTTARMPSNQFKLFSMVNYFSLQHSRQLADASYLESSFVSFERRVEPLRNLDFWKSLDTPLSKLEWHTDKLIEDYPAPSIEVDFANMFIGGGVLNHGCVQEEIMFSVQPECLISTMISDVMQDNEAIIIVGSERVTKHSGYGHDTVYVEPFQDNRDIDSHGRKNCHIAAIDALEIFHQSELNTRPDAILREINKAYTGFLGDGLEEDRHIRPIVTGKWGCGAFGGECQVKTLLQWIAASRAQRNMVMMTFKDRRLNELQQIIDKYSGGTVGRLLTDILEVADPDTDLFPLLLAKN